MKIKVFSVRLSGRTLIEIAKPLLTPSLVQYGAERVPDVEIRTGESAKLPHCAPTYDLRRQIAAAAGCPLNLVEPLWVLKYSPGDFFKRHQDGDNRSATALIPLSSNYAGGETHFPRRGVKLRASNVGVGVLFESDLPAGEYHESLPVTVGEKWVAVTWIRKGDAS